MKFHKIPTFVFNALVAVCLASAQGHAAWPDEILALGGRLLQSDRNLMSTLDYQIGEGWGKVPVTPDSMAQESPAFRMSASRTARVGSATGFFLGAFNGEFVMATNYHVMNQAADCQYSPVIFDFFKLRTRCLRMLGSWSSIDLTLFVVDLTAGQASPLLAVAQNFSFAEAPRTQQALMTFGYGIGGNPRRHLVVNQDEDCRVFSATSNFRLMSDPDEFIPGSYQAWSFANGCDVSHGDSGSAMVDRATGAVLGIIWTGKIPKNERVRSEAYLRDIEAKQSEAIWTELSYAVPAVKMKDVLLSYLASGQAEARDRSTLFAILQ